MLSLTTKQIAQTYMLNDIVVHEIILESLNTVEIEMANVNRTLTMYDIVRRLQILASRHELFPIFELTCNDILKTLREEYLNEINDLVEKSKLNVK